MVTEFFGRQRGCRFYTAGCGNKMAVSVTGPRAVNVLGGPVIPGTHTQQTQNICITFVQSWPNVFDVGQKLYRGYANVLCLLAVFATWQIWNKSYQMKLL